MAITLRRQISDKEKEQILKLHMRICFATGHTIPDGDPVHFDHIKAFASGGVSEIDNIAPMCEAHNKQKGQLPLYDFKIKLQINEFFDIGPKLTLKRELEFLKKRNDISTFGEIVNILSKNVDEIELEINNKHEKFTLYKCPVTGWEYFYATLPIEVLNSDDDEKEEIGLQPRYLIAEKVFNLFRHFQKHSVLQPSICRYHNNRILVFDGQHKIAGLLWGSRRKFECKVYLNPEPKLLNDTNISAHDKFAQTRFFSSIMVAKLGRQFGNDFDKFKNIEDGSIKSEENFLKYLRNLDQLTNAEVNRKFRSFLYNSILEDPNNKLSRFVSDSNRGTDDHPITIDMLQKSIFASFLYTYPVAEDMTSGNYLREMEFLNNVRFCNMLYEEGMYDWDSKRSKKDPKYIKLNRMFRSKSIMSWSELVHSAVCGALDIHDPEDREMPFYRELSEAKLIKIRDIIRRLVNWKIWDAPDNHEIDRVLADNKSVVKQYFKDNGLSTGYLMGAPD